MKKIFTLIATVAVALSAHALDYKVTAAEIAQGSTLVDNDYVTVTTANNTVTPTIIKDEDDQVSPVTYAGETFNCYVAVRTTDAPTVANPTATPFDNAVALVINAKQNTDVTLYYKVGASKSIDCFDQKTGEAIAIEQNATNPGDDYLFCTGVYKFQAGHTYTVWAKGGTIQFHGLSAAKGTYVAPTAFVYANASAKDIDGFSTISFTDGAKLVLMIDNNTVAKPKSYSAGSNVTINGRNYKGTKVSNGAQNQFVCPEGKKAYSVTIYSVVNKDAATDRPCYWKEVNGVEYAEADAKIMESYKDNNNPDVNTYDLGGVSEFTFTNTGEQNYFVLEVSYDPASGVAGVAEAAEASNGVVKAVKNGQIVIVKNGAEYTVSGAQIK